MAELQAGTKRSHWMWFVFPQLAGLGRSSTARFYGLVGLAEAEAYARHPLLGTRLVECTEAMLGWANQRSAGDILGPVDAVKFRSSMTLFELCAPAPTPFVSALNSFFDGERDPLTLALI